MKQVTHFWGEGESLTLCCRDNEASTYLGKIFKVKNYNMLQSLASSVNVADNTVRRQKGSFAKLFN